MSRGNRQIELSYQLANNFGVFSPLPNRYKKLYEIG
jgi:hypothetical protein